jgi:oligoendopeptidase F
MELLGAPYLTAANGGFYATEAEAARHRINHLHKIITFWPYMAVVDGFQHWVYRHMDEAMDPANCNAKWAELWRQFIPGVDFTGFEEYMVTGWHRKLHIFRYPFYYVEYGMAQVGAIQVWRNSLVNQVTAVAQYRHALSLGGARTLPDLFAAAGATFRFDTAVMQEIVGLLEQTLRELS